MNNDSFLKELEERFYQNGVFLKKGSASQKSCLNVIKSYLLKKNLVIVSKVDYERLKNKDMYDSIEKSIDSLRPDRVN